MLGIVGITVCTILDPFGALASFGIWCHSKGIQKIVIFIIFFLSGAGLETDEWRAGIKDIKAILAALILIFIISPAFGFIGFVTDIPRGYWIGFLLVAAMPTTLSSGVVMTKASGGNTATALIITIVANFIAIFTIPHYLRIFLHSTDIQLTGVINAWELTWYMVRLVALPLALGCVSRSWICRYTSCAWMNKIGTLNSVLIISMVWIAVSESRNALLLGLIDATVVAVLMVIYHVILVLMAFLLCRIFTISDGPDRAVIFMGAQKTVTLAVLLQTSLFPQYGDALMVCVIHHILHLIVDGYLVGFFRHRSIKIVYGSSEKAVML